MIGGECRFANIDDLAVQLDLPQGHRRSEDVLAAAWLRWGAEAAGHLHGEFTFFAYDPTCATVWLCRDQTPSRPLFFVHYPGRFIAFCNHPRPLLALPGVDPGLDDVAFAAAVTMTAMDATETGYKDLRRVPRAHVLTLTRDAIVDCRRWWVPTVRDAPTGWSDDDYVEAARNLFDRVVRDHYGGDGERTGILLSGGLDSLAVAESVLRQKLGPLIGYAVFDPPDLCVWRRRDKIADQRPVVDAFLQNHPDFTVRFIPYRTAPGDMATMDRQRQTGLFSTTPHLSGLLEDARRMMKADGITTVLGGQGGNQTLSADGWHHLDDLRNSGRWFALAWNMLHFVRRRGPSMMRALAGTAVPDWVWRLRRRPLVWTDPHGSTAFLSPETAKATAERYGWNRAWAVARDKRSNMLEPMGRDHPYLDGLYLPWRAHGMSLRTPFADRRIVDFALSVPASQYLRRGRTRWLMRRMLAGRLPEAIVNDHRFGDDFSSFPIRAETWRESMRAALPGLQSSASARRIFDLEAMERFLGDDWPAIDTACSTLDQFIRISDCAQAFMAARFLQMTDGGNG
ncbi:asparagine synthase-related protein [Niveispirillum sp. SYP-B3756]|uniref:asparagine synthase-related protein n=1 Tax=Niveispirillum sp. SYP-B3756 TaxID=2662178 RepID=UPI0015637148